MKLKRISAAVLALVMAAALTAPAFAEEDGIMLINDTEYLEVDVKDLLDSAGDPALLGTQLLIAPNPYAGRPTGRYNAVVSLNGEDIAEVNYAYEDEKTFTMVDNYKAIESLPAAPAGYVPMRLLTQADPKGSVEWYPWDKEAYFYFHGSNISCSIREKTVFLEFQVVEDVELYIEEGVTYLPVSFLAALPGVEVDEYTVGGVVHYDFYLRPLGTPMEQLVTAIRDDVNMGAGANAIDYFEALELDISDFEEVAGLVPLMNVNSDSVVIGKYRDGADKKKAQAALQALKDLQIQNFTNYLPKPLERAKNGQIVESKDGRYVMLIISGDNDAAIKLFEEGVKELELQAGGIMPR